MQYLSITSFLCNAKQIQTFGTATGDAVFIYTLLNEYGDFQTLEV